jgi:hypothetical protein
MVTIERDGTGLVVSSGETVLRTTSARVALWLRALSYYRRKIYTLRVMASNRYLQLINSLTAR